MVACGWNTEEEVNFRRAEGFFFFLPLRAPRCPVRDPEKPPGGGDYSQRLEGSTPTQREDFIKGHKGANIHPPLGGTGMEKPQVRPVELSS